MVFHKVDTNYLVLMSLFNYLLYKDTLKLWRGTYRVNRGADDFGGKDMPIEYVTDLPVFW